MVLQYIQGFDGVSDPLELDGSSSNAAVATTIKNTGTQSLFLNSLTARFDISLPSVQDTYIIGFAYRTSGAILGSTTSSQSPFVFYNGSDYQFTIYQSLDGRLNAFKSPTLLGTTTNPLPVDTWVYIEFKITIKNSISANDFIIKVDGVEELNLSATTDTQYQGFSGFDTIRFRGPYNSGWAFVDDVYIVDITGSVNNDFLGTCRVEAINPNGNGNANQFNGSDGNSVDNYLHVDELLNDGDTSYVESETVSQKDQYTFSNLTGAISTIHGVSADTVCKKTEADVRTGKLFCRQGGADYEGDEFSPTTSYFTYSNIWETDPDTAVAWLEAGVNAAEFGIKVES
jgi:hypothetical protein